MLSLVDFSGRYPWEWSVGDADDYFSHARAVRNLSHSTVRSYQGAVKLFCDYACSPQYDWCEQSAKLFGRVFAQVVTELNRVTHCAAARKRDPGSGLSASESCRSSSISQTLKSSGS